MPGGWGGSVRAQGSPGVTSTGWGLLCPGAEGLTAPKDGRQTRSWSVPPRLPALRGHRSAGQAPTTHTVRLSQKREGSSAGAPGRGGLSLCLTPRAADGLH